MNSLCEVFKNKPFIPAFQNYYHPKNKAYHWFTGQVTILSLHLHHFLFIFWFIFLSTKLTRAENLIIGPLDGWWLSLFRGNKVFLPLRFSPASLPNAILHFSQTQVFFMLWDNNQHLNLGLKIPSHLTDFHLHAPQHFLWTKKFQDCTTMFLTFANKSPFI